MTAIFCDVVGSTALGESRDPEAVRALLARYFERMRSIVEAHGGTVQKFIGDAVVAIFGVPAVHEDDALRGLRAAEEMRRALPALGVEARFGVNTGEVVTSADDTLVTGDAVNVAARLQQAAEPGEILVGAETRELAGASLDVEELQPLDLKGKHEPVAAFRLVSVGEASERSHVSRFVGREVELALLRAAWERAAAETRCELVTVVGEPGVGKSRLTAELIATLDTRVVQGRCLSYGQGITYYPVIGVIKQLDGVVAGPEVAVTLESVVGESDAASSPDEIAWAFRKLLEAAGAERPLVVVFDDIQWGEETFLDLVEHVALFSSGSPMLILCLARPELSERRPQWPVTLRLEPLPASEVEELLPASLPEGMRRRIAQAAGGNPLFVTEMVAMAAETGGEVVVPATLKALLAARIDRLESQERGVLERGAVEGEVFHRGSVQALVPAGTQVTPQLSSLVRRELIRSARAILPGEDAFRFCHLLIRDAAYDALPKTSRAELHERFADWLDQHGSELATRDEIAGYHLQQAYRYRAELGQPDEVTGPLGERAAARLAAAGHRARARGDHHAAVNLFERALELDRGDPGSRAALQVELCDSLVETGRIQDRDAILQEAHAAALAVGDRGLLAALALIQGSGGLGNPNVELEQIEGVTREAIETYEELHDERGLARARRLRGLVLPGLDQGDEANLELERAVVHADACGDPAVRRRVVGTLLWRYRHGPTPAAEEMDRLERLLPTARSDRVLEASVQRFLGHAYAMVGRPAEALALIEQSSAVLDELNQRMFSMYRDAAAEARLLSGDTAGAERELLARWRYFAEGQHERDPGTADSAYALASFYCDSGRFEEAERFVRSVPPVPLSRKFHIWAAALRLAVEARIAAHQGRFDEALALADEPQAVIQDRGTADPNYAALVWLQLAEARRAAGDRENADEAHRRALELYELKGNLAAAALVRGGVAD